MDFAWFRNLETLAKTGSFSRAAEIANVTQPAFSRRIKSIESWVGATLVDRSSYPISLTEAGRQMLEAGEQALSRIETERALVRRSLASPDKYVVTFATQHSIGWRFYPSWLQMFEERFGPIMSRLRADDLPNCIDDLKDGNVDFVIAYQSDYSRSLPLIAGVESLSIGADALIPVCKATADGKPLFSLDTAGELSVPFLRFGDNAPIGQHIDPVLRVNNLLPKLKMVYENSMSGALRIRARDGAGIAWLPQSLVLPDLEAGLLTLAGGKKWKINLDIRLHRLVTTSNPLTQKIWTFLAKHEKRPARKTEPSGPHTPSRDSSR